MRATDSQLKDFAECYFKSQDCDEVPELYFAISMAERFRMSDKAARGLVRRCIELGIVEASRRMVKMKNHREGWK